MSATVEISETNGTSGSPTTTDGISAINFGSADIAGSGLVPSSHKIVRSSSANRYSFAKWVRLHVSSMGGSTTIATMKVWKTAGAYVTGEAIAYNGGRSGAFASDITSGYGFSCPSAGSGGSAVTVPYSGTGTQLFGDYISGGLGLLTAEPTNANNAIAGAYAGTLTATGYSNYLILGMGITSSTPNGPVNQKTFKFQWDES